MPQFSYEATLGLVPYPGLDLFPGITLVIKGHTRAIEDIRYGYQFDGGSLIL